MRSDSLLLSVSKRAALYSSLHALLIGEATNSVPILFPSFGVRTGAVDVTTQSQTGKRTLHPASLPNTQNVKSARCMTAPKRRHTDCCSAREHSAVTNALKDSPSSCFSVWRD